MPTPSDIERFANQILAGHLRLCTWFGDYAEQRKAAQRALDGDTDDLNLMLDVDAAEVWLLPEWEQDAWLDGWQATASESTVPMVTL